MGFESIRYMGTDTFLNFVSFLYLMSQIIIHMETLNCLFSNFCEDNNTNKYDCVDYGITFSDSLLSLSLNRSIL